MKKMLKYALLIALLINIMPSEVKASSLLSREIIYLENGYYVETVIRGPSSAKDPFSMLATTKTVTNTKTSYYKDASGNTLWQIAITASFEYNGSSSKCTSCFHSASSSSNTWSIQSSSSSKSGNSATATATAKQTGVISGKTVTRSVTIKCDANGKVS